MFLVKMLTRNHFQIYFNYYILNYDQIRKLTFFRILEIVSLLSLISEAFAQRILVRV